MKSLLTATITVGLVAGSLSTIEKTGHLIDRSKVSYNISDDKTLDGAYVIKDVKEITRLRGAYTKNKRSGNWYCFDAKGELVMRYNYDLKKLVSLDEKQLDGFSIMVMAKNPEVEKNASIPVAVCSVDQLKAIVIEEFKDGVSSRLKAEGGMIKADFTVKINEQGEAKYFVKYVFKDLSYSHMIYVNDKVFHIEWLPATFQDKTYKSEIGFSSEFYLEPGDHKRFIWNQ